MSAAKSKKSALTPEQKAEVAKMIHAALQSYDNELEQAFNAAGEDFERQMAAKGKEFDA